jgi:hypothetical protein
VGVAFWRATPRGGDAGSAAPTSTPTPTPTPTWQFTVGARTAPVDTSWGATLDVNGDGYADVLVGAYLHLGGADGPATLPSTTLLTPAGTTLAFQSPAAAAGDVNGDGYGDLVAADPNLDFTNGSFAAYVYLGSASGLSPHPGFVLSESSSPDGFTSVAGVGDLNGDGYADIVLGDRGLGSGDAFVYLGSAAGPSAAPDLTLTIPGGALAYSVTGAGDVNGDGYGDILIGGFVEGGPSTPSTGVAYVYPGGATGPSTMPLVALTLPDASLQLVSVAGAGDVNGDGYADLLVGIPNGQAGGAFLYLGSPTGPSAVPSLTYSGRDGLFGFSSTGVGDVNGDGYADFVIGDSGITPAPQPTVAPALLFLGGSTAPATPAVTLANPDSTGVTAPFVNMVGAGDVNGDGYADFVTTVFGARQFGYVGGAGGLAATPAKTLD